MAEKMELADVLKSSKRFTDLTKRINNLYY